MKGRLRNTCFFIILLSIVLSTLSQQSFARNTDDHKKILFGTTYTITASPIVHATVSFNPGATVASGADVTVNITTDPGYEVSDLIVDGVSVGAQNSYTFTNVTSDHTISGQTIPSIYSITASAGAHGTVVEANGYSLTGLPYGTFRTMNIIPDANYHIADVLVDGVSVGAVTSYAFSNINASHTISATFAINTYTIQMGPDKHSTISISPDYIVDYGGTATANITVNQGYALTNVFVDGAPIGIQNSYTFSNVTSNHLIESFTEPLCTAPAGPTALNNIQTTTTSISGTISSSDSPAGYMVVSSTNTINTLPVDGTTYAAGTSFGGGTIQYAGTSSSFTANGLSSNTIYHLYVYAYNNTACANGPVYSSATTYSEMTAPDAPTNVTATAGNGSATVSFTPPGGTQNTAKYTVTSNPGNIQTDGLTSPIIVNGLTNGTIYSFTVTATNNAHETSTSSGVSNSVTPLTPCTAPASAIELNNLLITTSSFGGTIVSSDSPTGYMVVSTVNTVNSAPVDGTTYAAGTPFGGGTIQYVGTSPSFSINGLSSNTIYHLYVYAYNNTACGGGPLYSSATTYTEMTAPDAPGNVVAVAGIGSAIVSFTPPGGIQNISKYTVTSNPGNIQTDGLTSPITITGLTNGTIYSFTVTATNNAHETSNPSGVSNSVTPLAQTFEITTSAGANGAIDASSTVNEGQGITVNITPDLGYHVADVLVDGTSVGAVTSYAFNNVTDNHTISATFAPNKYKIAFTVEHASFVVNSLSVDDYEGNITNEGSDLNIGSGGTLTVDYNSLLPIQIMPDQGYEVALIVNGVEYTRLSNGIPYSTTLVNNVPADQTVEVLVTHYSITTSAGANGKIDASSTVYPGQNSIVNITSDLGYHVADVLVDGASAGAVTSYAFNNVTDNHTISTTFAPNKYKIAFTVEHANFVVNSSSVDDYAGNITNEGSDLNIGSGGTLTVDYNSLLPIQIMSDQGYEVALIVNGVEYTRLSNGIPYSTTLVNNVPADQTVEVLVTHYSITTSAGANGTIDASSTVYPGQNSIVNITPDLGYHVADVLVDGASVGAVTSYAFNNVTDNHTISATFAINTYTISSSAGANGYIDPGSTINYGGDEIINITPNTGYHVADVLVDGLSVGAVSSYTFSDITQNHTISATFASNVIYTIKATAGTNGSISPSGTVSVYSGSNQTYTITPVVGYHVAIVKVDGISVNATTSYTFIGVTANHTISATFAINNYTITSSAGSNGSISPNGIVSVNFGGSKTYTIKPAAGYTVANVLVDGVSIGAVSTYTFTNITANHTISASFTINGYIITASAGNNGTITPSGVTPVNYGGTIIYNIIPAANYHIAGVMVDGVAKGAITSYTFSSVKANHTINANFAINTYTITASAGANGTITPNGISTVNYGSNQIYTLTPNTGYAISTLTIDGTSVAVTSSYTFSNVSANHKISVSFICIKPSMPVISGPAVVNKQQNNLVYTVMNFQPGYTYTWTVPSGVTINSGQATSAINIKWGNTSGNVGCTASNNCSNSSKTTYAVTVSAAFASTNSGISSAQSMQVATTLKVYPNPVQDKAKVIFNIAQPNKCSVQLLDLRGKVLAVNEVNAVKGNNETSFDVSRFANGTYIVKFTDGKEIKTFMLIKAK